MPTTAKGTKKYAVGVDLGGTNIVFAATDLQGKILQKWRTPTLAQDGRDAVIGRMAEGVQKVASLAGLKAAEIRGVGVGSPGPLSSEKGIIFEAPNLPGFHNTPLREIMEKRLPGMRVFLENDANAAALGEAWAGAGVGVKDMIMLTLGTGVGGGIIVNGSLYSGADNTAGEFGHMVINPAGPACGCGQKGCLEQYASATAIARRARQAVLSGGQSKLAGMADGDPNKITSRLVHEAALAGDPLAREVWEEMIHYLAIGIANLINIFNPHRVVLGGGVMLAGKDLLVPLQEEVRKRAFDRPAKTAKIVAAKLGDDSGVIGAAAVGIVRSA